MAPICWTMLSAALRSQMQYRTNYVAEILFGFVYQTIGFGFVWTVTSQYHPISDWSVSALTVLYGIQIAGYSLWSLSFSRFFDIHRLIRNGEFDSMLLRPVPITLQFMVGGFRIAVLGDLLGAVIILGYGLYLSPINWTIPKVLYLLIAILASGMIRGAFALTFGSLMFRHLASDRPTRMIDTVFRDFGGYPLDIFDQPLRTLLTFVIPVAFIAWIPSGILLNNATSVSLEDPLAWLYPIVAAAAYIGAWKLFLIESRHYQSSGS